MAMAKGPAPLETESLAPTPPEAEDGDPTKLNLSVSPTSNGMRKSTQSQGKASRPSEEVKSQPIEVWVKQSKGVLWPTSWYVEAWERSIAIGLFYTFLITPIQVAYLQDTPIGVFVLNRIVDVMLLMDMVLILFVAVQEDKRRKRVWVTNIWVIRWHYIRGLFMIDFLSLLSSITEYVEYAGIDHGSGSLVKFTRFVRLIRLVRIVRMLRLAMVMNAIRKKVEDLLGSKEAGFIGVEMLKWIVELFLVAHCLGCAFGFTAIMEEQSENAKSWLKQVELNKGFQLDRDNDIGWIYLLSLYWAFTTMTTVGYGDIVPVTILEIIVTAILMLAGGCIWTLVMGAVLSVIGGLDNDRLQEGMERDALVGLCSDRGLDESLRKRLRDFLARNHRFKKLEAQQEILSQMSPALQGQVAVHTSSDFFEKVVFLRAPPRATDEQKDLHNLLRRRLAESLNLFAISVDEWCVPPDLVPHVTSTADREHMAEIDDNCQEELLAEQRAMKGHLAPSYVAPLTYLESGVAVLLHPRLVGNSWHHDMILRSAFLRHRQVAKAITFCSIYVLTPESLEDVLGDGVYGFQVKHIQKYARIVALTRLLQKVAEKASEKSKDQKDWDLVAAMKEVKKDAETEEKEEDVSDAVLTPVIETSLNLYKQQIAEKGTVVITDAALQEFLEGMRKLRARQVVMEQKLGLSAS